MAITCLRIPHLELRIALLDRPELDGVPLMLGNPESGRAVVLDMTDEAADSGIRKGMSLREASALAPDTAIITPNPAMVARVNSEILTRLEQLSPLVEVDEHEIGCWYVDLIGLDRHFPSPTAAAERILRCVRPILRPRAGLASTRFTARVASGVARPGQVWSVATGQEAAFLARAPVGWLPIPDEMAHQLRRLGLPTLGDIAALPPARLAARFGPTGRLAWELATGADRRLIMPRSRELTLLETMEMPTPAVTREMVMVGLQQLVQRAFGRAELRGKQVRQVTLRAMLEGRRSWERPLVLKRPCGQAALSEALRLRLWSLELPGPVESVSLQFSGLVTELATQAVLPMLRPRHEQPVHDAVDQLKHRYGCSPLFQIVEVEPWSRIPERRHALITFEP